jgi:hypothetical protein
MKNQAKIYFHLRQLPSKAGAILHFNFIQKNTSAKQADNFTCKNLYLQPPIIPL